MLHSRVRAAWAGWRQHVEATRGARQHAAKLHLQAALRLQHQVQYQQPKPDQCATQAKAGPPPSGIADTPAF